MTQFEKELERLVGRVAFAMNELDSFALTYFSEDVGSRCDALDLHYPHDADEFANVHIHLVPKEQVEADMKELGHVSPGMVIFYYVKSESGAAGLGEWNTID